MRFKSVAFLFLGIVLASQNVLVAQALPAFSGAEGPGAVATGGRGGDVYHVTNLNPDKNGTVVGSLTYGINNAPSAGRTIVFDVGGTIYLAGQTANDTLRFSKANITIAGQTAPGPGITIAGTGTKWSNTNMILRNMAIRPNLAPVSYDAFSLQVTNSIIDHVSATWFTDEGISQTDSGKNSTIQYSLISEGLGGHAFGSLLSTEVDGTMLSVHHNLYSHNVTRQPRIGSETGDIGLVMNFTNNVIYDWYNGNAGTSGGSSQNSSTNFVGNYYIVGNNTGTNPFSGGSDTPGDTKIYQSDNKIDRNQNGVIDGVQGGTGIFSGERTFVSTPFAVPNIANVDSADVALQRVLAYSGPNWQNRAATDQRIVNNVTNNAGTSLNNLNSNPQSSEWATLMAQRTATTRPADFDTDRDGMPDTWELAHGLSPSSASGANGNNGDFDNDGYTNIEEYINELAEWPAPGPLVFSNVSGNSRYALIRNWGNIWQPSKFDTAQIRSGTAIVDAVGQHAGTLSVAPLVGNNATLRVTSGWLDIETGLQVGTAGIGIVDQTNGLVIAPTVTLGGSGAASGTYNLSGGMLRVGTLTQGANGGTFNLSGGTLVADRILMNMVTNGGTIAPGDGIGTTQMSGNLTLNASKIDLEVAGSATNQTDRLVLSGSLLTNGSTLKVTFLNSFIASEGDRFDLLDFNTASGSIAFELPTLNQGLMWSTQNFLVDGSLSVISSVPEPSTASLLLLSAILIAATGRKRSLQVI